jgi:transcriptional regulator with XRE-family HTH domain
MPEATTIGRRVQSVRKRRGLSQADLAKLSGISVSLIRQLEQGQRDDTRLETLRKLAVALRVPTAELAPRTGADDASQGDIQRWEPVRRAVEGTDADQPGDSAESPTLAGVEAAFQSSKPLFRRGEFADLVPILSRLLNDADTLVDTSGSNGTNARRLRSRVRQMAAWMMILTWQFDTADLAIRLALDDAPDVRAAVPLMDAQCWRYIRQGDLAQAREVSIKWADDIEPHKFSKASRDELASWGLMLLRVSTAAIRDNRPGEADDALTFAKMAAMGIRRVEHNSDDGLLHAFGPKTVAMLSAENAMVVDRPDVTLSVSSALEGDSYPLPWVWNRHRLDVAHAHTAVKQYPEALAVLQEVRRDLPEWIVKQRYARDILSKIVEKRRTLTPEMRELADFISLPY